jgi:POT family proton-dependent oligopeptide transporter
MNQTAPTARMPRQIPYIIGNEACERFSFYGMRNILVQFLISSVILAYMPEGEAQREGAAKDVFHSFVIGVYFFPLLGGWLADRFFGKYNTVLWFSLIYCAGHACLALFEDNSNGFYTGLFLIALGSGGIKPLVVSSAATSSTRATSTRPRSCSTPSTGSSTSAVSSPRC